MILPWHQRFIRSVDVGLYDHVIAALEQRDVSVLGMYAIGALIGLTLFSRVLHMLLMAYRDLVVSVLLGLMVGSLRVLWPWPSDQGGLENTRLETPPVDELLGASIAALLGGVALSCSLSWWHAKKILIMMIRWKCRNDRYLPRVRLLY